MKTYSAKPNEVTQNWLVVDLKGQTLGRVASTIANLLRGRHKTQFTPHIDTGDFVIALNADQIKLTGNKLEDKFYYEHSLHPGGLRSRSAREMLETKPEEMIWLAVNGMLPKNKMRKHVIKKLKVYRGTEHPHQAQQPVAFSL